VSQHGSLNSITPEHSTLDLGGISVDVVRKDIKHLHLSVYPPTGSVRIAAPTRMNLETIRIFAISKLPWIKQHQHKLQDQPRETPREYVERESHFVWGQRYLLEMMELDDHPSIELLHRSLRLSFRTGSSLKQKEDLLETWYRTQLRSRLPDLIEKWQKLLGVEVKRIFVQRMKTRWGSCNPNSHAIRLNTDLAKKPIECLEYILLHEMMHLIEPTHNQRFQTLMDQFMPNWRHHRAALNNLPVRHSDWTY
jgi:predicted metal-dependent hydrolase